MLFPNSQDPTPGKACPSSSTGPKDLNPSRRQALARPSKDVNSKSPRRKRARAKLSPSVTQPGSWQPVRPGLPAPAPAPHCITRPSPHPHAARPRVPGPRPTAPPLTYIIPLDEFGALLEAVGHAHWLELQGVHSGLCPSHLGSSGFRVARASAAGMGSGAPGTGGLGSRLSRLWAPLPAGLPASWPPHLWPAPLNKRDARGRSSRPCPRAGRRVESPWCLCCLRRREGTEPGSASRPPPDPAWPPPRSAPFSTSSVPRGSARVTRSGPLLPPLLPPLLRHPRSRSSSPSSLPNFERWVNGGKRGRSGTSRLPGPTAADACATRPLSMPRAGGRADVPGAFRGTRVRAWMLP